MLMEAGSERCYIAGFEDGGRGPQPLKARKDKETDLDFVPGRPVSDCRLKELEDNRCTLF